MSKINYYTEEGLQNLKDEIEQLERIERPKLSALIGAAIDLGDLSENAEYHAGNEADIKLRKISVESPIGKGLLGKSVGDIAPVETPNGTMEFQIISISR
jgi:transcription elongation GreA/GreB family factor